MRHLPQCTGFFLIAPLNPSQSDIHPDQTGEMRMIGFMQDSLVMEIELWKVIVIALGHSTICTFSIASGGGSSFVNQPFMMLMGLPPKQAIGMDIVSDAMGRWSSGVMEDWIS